MKFLAISGSVRAQSGNTALLRAAADAAPDGLAIDLFARLEEIPAFNPDRESETPPDAVAALREAVRAHDAVLFSTPEYAHGVPGVLKNALDWLVGSGEFYEKAVALVHASPRGEIARASLKEVIVTMGAKLVADAVVDPSAASQLATLLATIATEAAKVQASAEMG